MLAFSLELSIAGAPAEVRARVQPPLVEQLGYGLGEDVAASLFRAMRLVKHDETSLSFRPKLLVPTPFAVAVFLRRRLSGERVDVTFAPDADDGHTRVTVTGTVGTPAQALAERDLWVAALGAE